MSRPLTTRLQAIQHPTAGLIARSATAVDDIIGDGTTTQVLLVGEILHQCERLLAEGIHPRNLTEGLDLGRARALEVLESSHKVPAAVGDRELLLSVARTSLRTKVEAELADKLAAMVVEAIVTVKREGQPIDLFMVEILSMQHRSALDTRLVKGIVMDHGGRHPGMPKRLTNCWILTLNVSLEYEKTEVNSEAIYSTADERDRLVEAERRFIDDRVRRIIDLKRVVCAEEGTTFVVINQKGIDPPALDMCVWPIAIAVFLCGCIASFADSCVAGWPRRASWVCGAPSGATWSASHWRAAGRHATAWTT